MANDEKLETILRVNSVPTENSNYTKFDYLLGIEPSDVLLCNITIVMDYLCIGINYSLFKCEDWLFDEGKCRDDSAWRPIFDIRPGLQKINISISPDDPGLGTRIPNALVLV